VPKKGANLTLKLWDFSAGAVSCFQKGACERKKNVLLAGVGFLSSWARVFEAQDSRLQQALTEPTGL
jgi:hypothetical protein